MWVGVGFRKLALAGLGKDTLVRGEVVVRAVPAPVRATTGNLFPTFRLKRPSSPTARTARPPIPRGA